MTVPKIYGSISGVEIIEDNREVVSQGIKNAIRNALREIGKAAVGHATDRVPVRTGNLKSSIAYDSDDEQVIIGSDVYYASYVELGTSKMRAQPYLRPAIQDHGDEYRAIIEKHLRNA